MSVARTEAKASEATPIILLVIGGAPFVFVAECAKFAYHIAGDSDRLPLWAILCGLAGTSAWLLASALAIASVFRNSRKG